MRLQLKVTLIMVVAVALTTFATSAVLWYAIFPSYLELEEDEARRNVARVHAVMDEDIASLARTATDWATWDDTYQFVAGRKPSFVEENLSSTSVANLNVGILYAEDAERRPVLTVIYDRATNEVDTVASEAGNAFASAARSLMDRAWVAGEASGLVLVRNRLFMVAARGVQPSDRNAPANGMLVFGRTVDEEATESLSRRVRLPIRFDEPALREDAAGDLSLDRTDEAIIVTSVLRDIDRRPLLALRSDLPRSIVNLGGRTLLTAALSLVLTAVMILFLLWVALRVIIIRPIRSLTESLDTAGKPLPADPAGRTDEVGTLAHALKRHVELQRALAEADAARRIAEEANRVKTQFLAQMSHELRTPLNAVLGFSEIMEQRLFGPLSDTYREYAFHIRASGKHLLNIIDGILDMSKIEAGELKLASEPVDVAAVADESVRLVRGVPASRRLTITTDIPDELPLLRADVQRMRQVLLNLLSNAVKFTPEGGHVTLRAQADPDGLVVSVRDTGIGIPAEHLETVLKPFVQVDNGLTRRHDGTGLGLSLAKEFTRLMGGTLTVSSAVGAGTTVSLAFPAERLLVPQRQR